MVISVKRDRMSVRYLKDDRWFLKVFWYSDPGHMTSFHQAMPCCIYVSFPSADCHFAKSEPSAGSNVVGGVIPLIQYIPVIFPLYPYCKT